MATYQTTVILKTDIVDSTPRLAEQTQTEMGLARNRHKQFISETAAKNQGVVFQEEGDAYLIEFPSVTDAVFAAMDMHETLRSMQAGKGEKQRLAIRAVITVGDLLHQGNDMIGMAMSLTARIEKITPPDEIYLSQAAWLLLNKAEVNTSFVGEFPMKGFAEPEKIYEVDQKHRTRVLTDQFIVFTDIRGWTGFALKKGIEEVEDFLFDYHDLLNEICEKHNGNIRNVSGDECFLTFSEADNLFSAIHELCASWKKIVEHYQFGLSIAIHKGDLKIIRSYLYSNDIHTTIFLERLNSLMHPARESISVIVSGRVKENAAGTNWECRFQELDKTNTTDERLMSIIDEYGAYWFLFEDDSQS
jgi:class 3 adenylate cyclase